MMCPPSRPYLYSCINIFPGAAVRKRKSNRNELRRPQCSFSHRKKRNTGKQLRRIESNLGFLCPDFRFRLNLKHMSTESLIQFKCMRLSREEFPFFFRNHFVSFSMKISSSRPSSGFFSPSAMALIASTSLPLKLLPFSL